MPITPRNQAGIMWGGLKPSSKKTRIETGEPDIFQQTPISLKPSSKKTRIETEEYQGNINNRDRVSNHLPRKQGLKHYFFSKNNIDILVSNHLPRKQGLKLIRELQSRIKLVVSNHLPRKQGLKPIVITSPGIDYTVSNHLPRKQGLKLYSL